MPTPSKKGSIDRAEFKKIYNDTINYPTVADVAKFYHISVRTLAYWANEFRGEGLKLDYRKAGIIAKPKPEPKVKEVDNSKFENKITKLESEVKVLKEEKKELQKAPPLDFEERKDVKKIKDELTQTQRDLREAEKHSVSSDVLRNLIHGTEGHDFGGIPGWLEPKKYRGKSVHGIPLLFLSDLHFDEVVDPSQINNVNKYDREIATKRIQHTFNTAMDLLFKRTVNPKYDGIVLALGGDMLSGNIHEELAETNEDAIQRSLLRLADLLIDGVDMLLTKFDSIFIPCVVGNHGRHHKKPRAKNKVFDNYEWLIYQFMARHFKNDKRVTFQIPDGPDAIFKIYNLKFLLTHGDQFRGGNAIAGIFSPLMLGFHRKQKKQSSVGNSFDVMMVGHFHQYVHTNQLVINGTTKGYDEYANQMNFAFERPQQALFLIHPKNGMVMRTPILCDTYPGGEMEELLKVPTFGEA